MEEKRWTLEHHTWQGLGGDRQVLERTGLADRFLSSSYSLSPLSVSFCPHHQFPHHPLKLSDIVFFPLYQKGAYHPTSRISETQLGGVHQVSEVGFSLHSAFDGLRDPGQGSSPLGVLKCARKGSARSVIFKGWSVDPLEVSEALSGIYKIKTVFLTILRHYLSF